jgi:histone arginine demethylase JMJD6
LPVVIQYIPKVEKWKGNDVWDFRYLKASYSDRYFKVGEDDDGYKVKVKMKYFLRYLTVNRDDSPLYIFDSNFDTDAVSKGLLDEYQVPPYFAEDLLR